MKRHDMFTGEEWDEIDRVTNRWSDAGRAKDSLVSSSPIDGRKLQAAFAELSAAADDYHRTIERILRDLRARAAVRT